MHPDPLLIGFHEASRAEAIALAPVGRLARNDNGTKFAAAPDAGDLAYHVLSSRGLARPTTSAVDIAVPLGGVARSPVDGTVIEVRRYALGDGAKDWRVVLEPAGRPDLRVVLIHLQQPTVVVGDAVVAGGTALATIRPLPFASHIDSVLGERVPHVHIEVKPAVEPRPLDPNAPAEPAEQS